MNSRGWLRQYRGDACTCAPSNVPLIGRSCLPNLWVTAEHGTLGWTLGANSSRAPPLLINFKQPQTPFAFWGDA